MSNFDFESEQFFRLVHENHRRAAQRPVVLLLAAAAPAPLGSAEPEDEPMEVYADCEDVTVDDCSDWPTVKAQPRAANPAGWIFMALSELVIIFATLAIKMG